MRDIKWLAREYLYRLFFSKKRSISFQMASKEKDNKIAVTKVAGSAIASGQTIHFSKRELEIVSLYLKGNEIDHIAKILLLSPKTIEFYLRNASVRLTTKKQKEAEE